MKVRWLSGLLLAAAASVSVGRGALPSPVILHPNGGWCWFQDERAIVAGGKLWFGSVAGSTRAGYSAGDIVVTAHDLERGTTESHTLRARFQRDDHDVPALLELPDGRILATYQSHGSLGLRTGTDLMRWRTTVRPHDISSWTEEKTLPVGATVSYSNLFRLEGEGGLIFNFHRGAGYNPNYLVSSDNGATFAYGGRLLSWPRPTRDDPRFTGISGGRPYVKYVQQGNDTIHFVTTEDHPRSYDNSLYHAFIRGGKIHHSDGRVIGPLSRTTRTAIRPTDLTVVFRGDADHVAWMCDVQLDRAGHPRVVFSVQRDGAGGRGNPQAANDGLDLRYYYGRWDGASWQVAEIAHAGTRLYWGEDDYAGLATLDPQEPNVMYLSTNADPLTGAPLVSRADGRRHWEIFRGDSADDGKTWTWSPVTRDSTFDNLRPLIPAWRDAGGRRIVLWLRGVYRRYTDYDLEVVALLPGAKR